MKEIDKDYLEGELIQLYKQAAALSEAIVELAESEDQNEEQRRIRLTYLLDDLLHDATKKFEDYVDDLYSGDEEEGKALYDIRADRVLIMLMRRYGRNAHRRNKTFEDPCDLRKKFAWRAAEDFFVMQQLFGIKSIGYGNGVVSAEKDGITYRLDIDDENQDILGIEQNTTYDIGGNADENHA